MKKYTFLFLSVLFIPGISSCQTWKDVVKKGEDAVKTTTGSGGLTNSEIVAGLKQALEVGTGNGTQKVSQVDGYFKNPMIKILMPPDVKKVETTLRDVGLGSYVDKAILSMNRAAEEAGKEAKPVFVAAIKNMTITDAMGILKGADDAATSYLKRATSPELTVKFKPIIDRALAKTEATKYWKDVFDKYNSLPLVTPVNSDLSGYVTQKALDGLFYTIAQEELKIRNDPMARVTDLLKKVFAQQ